MRSAYLSDDFYLCLSKNDLYLLKESKETKGYILYKDNLYKCVVKISEKRPVATDFIFDKKLCKFILGREDFLEILKYGNSMNRIGDANFYVASELHEKEEFFIRSDIINGLAFFAETSH
ncbi:MAG: hypothetical protein RI945_153 [Candidatus Parcubacteria bacterium]|jgi:hypothetical protein